MIKTVPEFIAYAKATRKAQMASAGNGTPHHVAGELFKLMTNVEMMHVPYRGSAPALMDLIGAQVQVAFDTTTASIEYIRAGKLRALAVTTGTLGRAAGYSAMRDFVPGYEASRMVWRRRAEEHAGRDHREAEQRDQRGTP